MSNVVSFQPKPPPLGANNLIQLLQTLRAFTVVASVEVEKARSLDKLVAAYATWLRRYYELSGAFGQAYREAEQDVGQRGSDAGEDRVDAIIDCMAELEARVKGPHPWLSLPNRLRTTEQIIRTLSLAATQLSRALEAAEDIGKPAPRPQPGGAA